MSEVRVKLEPQDYDDCSLPKKQRLQVKRTIDSDCTRPSRRNGFDNAHHTHHTHHTHQQLDSNNGQYLVRGPLGSDVMPTLIPIRNSRSFDNTQSHIQKGGNTDQREGNMLDADVNMLYRVASHPEVLSRGTDMAAVEEINKKLSTLIANQSKIISQNEMILSKLNSSLGSKSQRIEHLDNILQGKHRNINPRARNEFVDERHEMRKDAPNRNGRHSSCSIVSSEGGSSFIHSEADIGQPPECKARRISDGMSSVSSGRSKSPSRDKLSVPSMTPISSYSHANARGLLSPSNTMPIQQPQPQPQSQPQSQRRVPANPCNMAVYVVRAEEQSHMVPILPIQYNKMKPSSQQGDINSSMLSSHPALIYNPETRQYEASYVTGIAHSNVETRFENGDLRRDAPCIDTRNVPVADNDNVIREASNRMQPNITNVVSLRRESAETLNPVFSSSNEMTNEDRPSATTQQAACSHPSSPIVIEEDVKPGDLQSQEEALYVQLRSFSMRNYAVQLMRALFRPHELMHRSVYENGERKGLDRKRLQQIKDYVFQIYQTPNKEKSLAWIECIAAMNEAIRSLK